MLFATHVILCTSKDGYILIPRTRKLLNLPKYSKSAALSNVTTVDPRKIKFNPSLFIKR